MRHFESAFVHIPAELIGDEQFIQSAAKNIPTITVPARIFACSSELDFAGHPLLGAASSIHNKYFSNLPEIRVQFELNPKRLITVNPSLAIKQ